MMKLKKLTTSEKIREEIYGLGDSILIFENGLLKQEIDLNSPCGFDEVMNINHFIECGDFKQAVKGNNVVTIITNEDNVIEFKKSNKGYFEKEDIINKIKELSSQGDLVIEEIYLMENNRMIKKHVNIDEVIQLVENLYTGKLRIKFKDFVVEENSISFNNHLIAGGCFTKLFIDNKDQSFSDELKSDVKIIRTNKFKNHMKTHENQFIVAYENIIKYAELSGKFKRLRNEFIEMIVELPFYVGYTDLCQITDKDTIVYAKRKNRDIYSKFTLNGERKLTNKCAFVLKQDCKNINQYYIITMFPGEYLIKEPQDKNIKSEEEKRKVLEFWKQHALVFDSEKIDEETIICHCPY